MYVTTNLEEFFFFKQFVLLENYFKSVYWVQELVIRVKMLVLNFFIIGIKRI